MRSVIVLAALAVGCAQADQATNVLKPEDAVKTAYTTPEPIAYHGGWIVTWDLPVYFIYYGNWLDQNGNWGPYGTSAWLIQHFTSQLGGTSWFSINSDYGDRWGNRASNQVYWAGWAWDYYSRGSNLSQTDIQDIVNGAIANGWVPNDPNGEYFVLTSPDVAEDGFCDQHCGWHDAMPSAGAEDNQRLYGFIGNPDRCPNNCGAYSPSPNGLPAADAMVSVLGHELSETVTDPHLDAWYSANGEENADHCAWNFGALTWLTNGAAANEYIGDRWYLIQQNWVPGKHGYCAQGAW